MRKNARLKIVFLDAATVDRKDLGLQDFEKLGNVKFFPRTNASQIISRCRGAEIIVSNKCVLGESEFRQLPGLRLIVVMATGYNNIDIQAAKRHGIAVCNVAAYSTVTVVEHTLLFLLSFSHRMIEHSQAAKLKWSRSSIFAVLDYPFSDLEGKTLGIVGYGTIGKRVANLAKCFGMNVLIAAMPGRVYPKSQKRRPLKTVFAQSDFISLHSALNKQTRHLINADTLKIMKKTACLLNLARGPLVDEHAIAHALLRGDIAGYASDVMEQEPPPRKHPFWNPKLKNKVLLTPHVAWASRESRQRLVDESVKNMREFLMGKKRNRVV